MIVALPSKYRRRLALSYRRFVFKYCQYNVACAIPTHFDCHRPDPLLPTTTLFASHMHKRNSTLTEHLAVAPWAPSILRTLREIFTHKVPNLPRASFGNDVTK